MVVGDTGRTPRGIDLPLGVVTVTGSTAPAVLRPVVAVSSRLRTSARLAVLVLVLVVPGLGATWAYSSVIGGQVAFSAAEESGVRVLRPTLVKVSSGPGSATQATTDKQDTTTAETTSQEG